MMGLKAFRVDQQGRLRFLFHAHNGSSVVPVGEWIEAKAKWASEGQRRRKYRCGFHFFPVGADMRAFNALTKGKYRIVRVRVEDVRPKPRSSVGSWLARRIYVPRAALEVEP
jgi:hypothetical protein